jgi:very-short-patch-repair endonuclease
LAIRTLMDLAASLPSRALERAVDEADRLGLAGHAELQAVAQAHRGHHGAARLATVLASHQAGSTLTRSELGETFLAICRSHNLPQPQLNVRIARYTVDFLWAHEMLIVETDGYQTHGTRRAFESDRERDARLTIRGYRILRFTPRQIARESAVVASLVRSALRGP